MKKVAQKTAKSAPEKEAITKPEKNELAKSVVDFEEDSGLGSEGMTKDDMTIPRLSILQDLSPQVKKSDDKYIEGAEAGDLLDNVLLETIPGEEGVLIVPITYRSTMIEWKTRKNGGGFVADHGMDKSKLNECQRNPETGAFINPDGNQIVQTAEYYVFIVDPGTGDYRPAVVSMSGAQLKHSRRMNTQINMRRVPSPSGTGSFNPAMFYSAFRFKTGPESNDQGSWFGWDISHEEDVINLPNGEQTYIAARAFREQVKEGLVKPQNEGASSDIDDDEPM